MNVQPENASGGDVKTTAAAALVVGACAMCCAPLIGAPVLGLLSTAGVGLALAGKIGLGALGLTGLGIYLFAKSRRYSVPTTDAKNCGCAADGGRNTRSTCNLSSNKPSLVEPGRNIVRSIC